MRRVTTTFFLAAGLVGGLLVPTTSAGGSVALTDPWEPDPFPLGVCVHAPELGEEATCVLVDPEDG